MLMRRNRATALPMDLKGDKSPCYETGRDSGNRDAIKNSVCGSTHLFTVSTPYRVIFPGVNTKLISRRFDGSFTSHPISRSESVRTWCRPSSCEAFPRRPHGTADTSVPGRTTDTGSLRRTHAGGQGIRVTIFPKTCIHWLNIL